MLKPMRRPHTEKRTLRSLAEHLLPQLFFFEIQDTVVNGPHLQGQKTSLFNGTSE
jgi:hypothetical protein